jgi:hypothetical protein
MFDHKGYLLNGKKKLYLWNSQSNFINISQSNVTGQNLNRDYSRMNVQFLPDVSDKRIIYPNRDEIRSFINRTSDNSQDDVTKLNLSLILSLKN